MDGRARQPLPREGSGRNRDGKYAGRPYRGDRGHGESARVDAALTVRSNGLPDSGQQLRKPEPEATARAREKLGDFHARLDDLTRQLDRMSLAQIARRSSASARSEPPNEQPQRQDGGEATGNPAEPQRTHEQVLLIDQAVAEITARQRALDGEATMPSPPVAHIAETDETAVVTSPPADAGGPPAMDFSGLEEQLRRITAQIDALAPARDLEKAMAAIRADLAEIGHQLNEALPRRALESIETEIKALGERIDHSRQSGVDPSALSGLERGLSEAHHALHALTPAESLVGFEEAVDSLTQKLDLILARDDPSALQQLEAAIGGLRGIVAHVASNDTLTKVAEDVRTLAAQVDSLADNAATGYAVSALEQRIDTLGSALAAQVDGIANHAASGQAISGLEHRLDTLAAGLSERVDAIANNAATGQAVSALDQRLDTLVGALTASSEAGHAVPRDLETLLAGLIEKLEWVQLTHTDHAALAHLEDRIATLVQRFDASDARLGHLEAIERGLADLLVHIEQMRDIHGLMPAAAQIVGQGGAGASEFERRTQDSLEVIQGTVERVIERLAVIEGGLRGEPTRRSGAANLPVPAQLQSPESTPTVSEATPIVPEPPSSKTADANNAAAPRHPLDPTLPPDHPLEPRSDAGRSRSSLTSETAVAAGKPPVIADAERPDFIAAARRAAQATAWEGSGQKVGAGVVAQPAGGTGRLSQRLRKLLAAGGAILILIGGASIATRLFNGFGPVSSPQTRAEQTPSSAGAPPTAVPAKPASVHGSAAPLSNPAQAAPADGTPAAVKSKLERQSMAPVEGAAPKTASVPVAAPVSGPAAAAMPSWATPDITGALPQQDSVAAVTPSTDSTSASFEEKLPDTIGNPALRKAALGGNPAAAYVVAIRFADGRGVLQDDEAAAYWLERASKAGLAPAQFRLGGFYERGIGVTKNLAVARDLYLSAAQKGNGNAMHNLAVLYAEGVDGQPDYGKAAGWFRKAADHGIKDSQYNLGILYARGVGVEKSDTESYKWFALAANQGDKDAAKKRDEIASHLDPTSLAAARLAVKNWSLEPQPEDAVNVKVEKAWTQTANTSRKQKPKPPPVSIPG